MNCIYCKSYCVKSGIRKTIQRYRCKLCKRYQQDYYSKPPISQDKCDWVLQLSREGCGFSSIGRLLGIAKSSVQRIIKKQSYEVDELRTYCGNKKNECWVIYAINRKTKKVIDFCVGRRTKG